jgi:hypothetical protein
MDCAHYGRELSPGDREFLVELLKQYDAKLMLESWVRKGQVKKPSGRYVDSGKARAVEILKREGFCRKERVHVYALDVACIFHTERKSVPLK